MLHLEKVFINILSMSTIASIVFILILFARKLLRNKVTFQKLNLLWIVFILVLIFPINFSSKLSIKNYIPNSEKVIIDISNVYKDDSNNINTSYSNDLATTSSTNYITILSIIWFAITIVFVVKDIIIYNTILLNNEKLLLPQNINEIFEKCKKKLNVKGNIKIVLQNKVKTPSLHGIWDPKILITNDIVELSNDEIEYIILHELNHYKNYHNIYYVVLNFFEGIYWFNPIMHFAGKIIREDLEFITDNLVVKEDIDIKEYGKTIVKISGLSSYSIYALPSICNDKEDLERRIKQMKNKVVDTKYSLVCIVVVITVISLVTISLASNKIETENNYIISVYSGEDEEIIKNLNELDLEKDAEVNKEITNNQTELVVPIAGARITSPFGKRVHPLTKEERFHSGVDVSAKEGEEIHAVADGMVISAAFDSNNGNYVKIQHYDGIISTYAHGSKFLVSRGDNVKAGDVIMLVGKTGNATGPHLHFEMINAEGEYIDVNQLFE